MHLQAPSSRDRSLKLRGEIPANDAGKCESSTDLTVTSNDTAAFSTTQSGRLGQDTREKRKGPKKEDMLTKALSTISEGEEALRLTMSVKGVDISNAPRREQRGLIRPRSIR